MELGDGRRGEGGAGEGGLEILVSLVGGVGARGRDFEIAEGCQ